MLLHFLYALRTISRNFQWLVFRIFHQLSGCVTGEGRPPSSSCLPSGGDSYCHFSCLGEKKLQLTEEDPVILLPLPPQGGQSLPSAHPYLQWRPPTPRPRSLPLYRAAAIRQRKPSTLVMQRAWCWPDPEGSRGSMTSIREAGGHSWERA